jgi:hypothetical protein
LPLHLDRGERLFQLLEPLSEPTHLLPGATHWTNPVNRSLDQPIHAVLELLDPAGDRLLTGSYQVVEQFIREQGGSPAALL